jgi:hypothetical protein
MLPASNASPALGCHNSSVQIYALSDERQQPVANPFMFLSNEADVLREIRAFAATVTGQ